MTGETDYTKTALALSGGGFRATLYHIGALRRLNELGLLAGIERLSSVSGGSIAAGKLAEAWPRLTDAGGGVFGNLQAEVLDPLRRFCRRTIDTAAVAWGTFLPGKSIGDVVAGIYEDHLVGDIGLDGLVDRPQFVFNATNLQTGRLVRLSKVRLADYMLGEIQDPDVPLAVAMAASSAFPPVLSPVTIAVDPARWRRLDGAVHFGDPAFNRKLVLTDGGAYDNLGLETVDTFRTLIISDAGAPFAFTEEASTFWPTQALRALDIATDQARALRKRLMRAEFDASGRVHAYAGIDSDPARFKTPRILGIDPGRTRPLAAIATRLAPFTEVEEDRLVNWGWYMTDLAVRGWIATAAPAPSAWPCPAHPLG